MDIISIKPASTHVRSY